MNGNSARVEALPYFQLGMPMSSPVVVDFSRLLTDIPGENPAGVNLRADRSTIPSLYHRIRDARNKASTDERKYAEQLLSPDLTDAEEKVGPPDWKPVLEHGQQALAEKTKDLEIAAFLIEALLRVHRFAGLRDGFRLARELVEKYWDRLYPLPDEEGVTTRVLALTQLNGADYDGTLPMPIAKAAITEAKGDSVYSRADYDAALKVNAITDPKARAKRIEQGGASLEKLQKAVADSSPQFYENLVQDLTECLNEFAKLSAALQQRCDGQAPPSSRIKEELEKCLEVVKTVARDKLKKAPVKEVVQETQAATGSAAGPSLDGNAIRDRDEAFTHLSRVADFFRRTEPHSIVSFALDQVVRWGQLSLPELLTELIPEEAPRKGLFQRVGIKPPELKAEEKGKK
jgi:type VI secretion system protein ImpA